MTADEIGYPKLVQDALRLVVRRVLEQVAANGLPGDHYFYLTFRTGEPGVELSGTLRQSYPETMTVVLQNQYWNLSVDGEGFEVTLRFGGAPERLRIPFGSLTHFVDPKARFALAFEPTGPLDEQRAQKARRDEPSGQTAGSPGEAEVISFEDFKKT
jgi:hypothetical protein